jgi:hypothetical protein
VSQDEYLALQVDGSLVELIRLVRGGRFYPPPELRARIAELNAAVAIASRYRPEQTA